MIHIRIEVSGVVGRARNVLVEMLEARVMSALGEAVAQRRTATLEEAKGALARELLAMNGGHDHA